MIENGYATLVEYGSSLITHLADFWSAFTAATLANWTAIQWKWAVYWSSFEAMAFTVSILKVTLIGMLFFAALTGLWKKTQRLSRGVVVMAALTGMLMLGVGGHFNDLREVREARLEKRIKVTENLTNRIEEQLRTARIELNRAKVQLVESESRIIDLEVKLVDTRDRLKKARKNIVLSKNTLGLAQQ